MAQSKPIENSQKLAAEIAGRLRALPNLRTEDIRALRREFSKRISKTSPRVVVEAAFRLMDSSAIEHRFVAYELVCKHPAALASVGVREIKRFGRGIDSWGSVDMFACYLSGPAWREHQIPDRLIHSWARSENRWWRRAALVSTVPLNNKARGGSGDTARTVEVCRMLIDDRDDMVVKALSWALRELSKRNPQAAEIFLNEHENVLAARVVREVRNKLSTGLKTPRFKNIGKRA